MSILHRENPSRGLFVTQDIDNELVNRLIPDIMRLRSQGRDPICLYIDSLGGSVFHAQKLLQLIKAKDQDGYRPHLISVAVGFAASAAADLLALGDYALAYPQSVIHYHGTRRTSESITLEDIPSLESSLRETNEGFALRLASRMFHRFVVRMIQLHFETVEDEDAPFYKSVATHQDFFEKIKQRVTDDQKDLIQKAITRQEDVGKLVQYIKDRKLNADSEVKSADMLKAVIDFELARTTEGLTPAKLDSIQESFFQLGKR